MEGLRVLDRSVSPERTAIPRPSATHNERALRPGVRLILIAIMLAAALLFVTALIIAIFWNDSDVICAPAAGEVVDTWLDCRTVAD